MSGYIYILGAEVDFLYDVTIWGQSSIFRKFPWVRFVLQRNFLLFFTGVSCFLKPLFFMFPTGTASTAGTFPDEIFEIIIRDILLVTRVKLEKLTREKFDMPVTISRKDTLDTKINM